ncbi:hypothetical protein BpHYR1_000666 [Brachionus plicatilis]|uniref:Transmembrane protein n=1 Tax=Brachionus plicatilis TaxID=10195 RepID=A0A3M7S3C5_BRAPC|nr:hypothetical protein BpHYR1_000666 [Brachionus plicatilis]
MDMRHIFYLFCSCLKVIKSSDLTIKFILYDIRMKKNKKSFLFVFITLICEKFVILKIMFLFNHPKWSKTMGLSGVEFTLDLGNLTLALIQQFFQFFSIYLTQHNFTILFKILSHYFFSRLPRSLAGLEFQSTSAWKLGGQSAHYNVALGLNWYFYCLFWCFILGNFHKHHFKEKEILKRRNLKLHLKKKRKK